MRKYEDQDSTHHIWWPRANWSNGARRNLRLHHHSKVRLTQEGHSRLHYDLQHEVHRFWPSIQLVIGMLALANSDEGGESFDEVMGRIEGWQRVCRDRHDDTADFLGKQAHYIDRGWPRQIEGSEPLFCQACFSLIPECEC